MTPEDRRVILSLVFVPGRGREGSPEDVLRHFGTADGRALGLSLLRDAAERLDELDLEMALIVCGTFGFGMEHLALLVPLCSTDWHHSHENVVSMLGELRTPAAVDALYQATQWVPAYLDFDESRALATKAIWALGNTPGPEAEQALIRLLRLGQRDRPARRSSTAHTPSQALRSLAASDGLSSHQHETQQPSIRTGF